MLFSFRFLFAFPEVLSSVNHGTGTPPATRHCSALFNGLNTSPGEGLRITRPGGGGAYSAPPAISAPRNARNTKLRGWVGPHKNSLWCKFGDPRSTSSRSNDVINAKFSHFLVKRPALCFSRSRAQTKTDSFVCKKRKMRNKLGYLG